MGIPALICALALLLAAPARAAEETWVKVQAPHFLVLSNGSLKDAREVATDFEQIHAVFAQAFPKLRTDSSADTIVLAVKDEKTFVEMLPREKKVADIIAGQFLKGWEKDYVLVRLDVRTAGREVVYHEYIHKLLHLNFTRLPVWLDEGLAEFFGNTEVRKDQALMGVPSPRGALLQTRTMYPLQTLLSVERNSPYYHDADKVGMFYAEAWGLTHFLMVGQGIGGLERMNSYLASLQKGRPPQRHSRRRLGTRNRLRSSSINTCIVSHLRPSAEISSSDRRRIFQGHRDAGGGNGRKVSRGTHAFRRIGNRGPSTCRRYFRGPAVGAGA